MTREEYLRRPFIKGVVYRIEKDKIQIWNDNTLFIQIYNRRKITLQEVQSHFRQLQQEAKASGKVRLKGSTKFLPAVLKLYPAYCASCNDIERLFTELTELVRQIERDGIHMGCLDDEVLEVAIRKQNEIARYYYRSSDYSRFLGYNNCVCHELTNKQWKNENVVACTISIV